MKSILHIGQCKVGGGFAGCVQRPAESFAVGPEDKAVFFVALFNVGHGQILRFGNGKNQRHKANANETLTPN